jgi:hypothetical protein
MIAMGISAVIQSNCSEREIFRDVLNEEDSLLLTGNELSIMKTISNHFLPYWRYF